MTLFFQILFCNGNFSNLIFFYEYRSQNYTNSAEPTQIKNFSLSINWIFLISLLLHIHLTWNTSLKISNHSKKIWIWKSEWNGPKLMVSIKCMQYFNKDWNESPSNTGVFNFPEKCVQCLKQTGYFLCDCMIFKGISVETMPCFKTQYTDSRKACLLLWISNQSIIVPLSIYKKIGSWYSIHLLITQIVHVFFPFFSLNNVIA